MRLSALLLALPLALAACGPAAPGEGAGSSASSAGSSASSTGAFCGGIAALPCPVGQMCLLDGSYPDAGGTCVPIPSSLGPMIDGRAEAGASR